MDKEFKFIIKILKNIKLKEEEKVFMRARLLEQFTPSLEVDPTVSPLRDLLQDIRNYFFVVNGHKFVPIFVVVFLIIFSSGVSSFAERALPGDLLYGIKVSINEPAVGMFTSSKIEKIKWKEKLVERRLEEVQKLISEDNLKETTRLDLENQIKEQIDDFSSDVSDLSLDLEEKDESESSSDLNIKLQTSLDSYKDTIEKISGDINISEDTKQETEKLLTTLGEYKEKVSSDYEDLQSNIKANSEVPVEEENVEKIDPTIIPDPTLNESIDSDSTLDLIITDPNLNETEVDKKDEPEIQSDEESLKEENKETIL